MTTIKEFSPFKIVKQSLENLKVNEKKIVTSRFGIETDRKTLSAIGRELNLSRERIRQIEREGLKKLASEIATKHELSTNRIIESFEKSGGLTSHENIGKKFLESSYAFDRNEFNSLHLIFVLMPQISKIEKTRELEAGWILAKLSKDEVIKVINEWVDHLQKSKRPETMEVLLNANPEHKKYELTFLSELPSISKKLVKTEENKIGLTTWPEVNPRNVRDKIYFVLKKNGKPMHFDEIANRIKDEKFEKKNIVKATVHNELIADKRFVLVGRGIYALSEWGYLPGTVADIIKQILAGKPKGMSVDLILKEVLKQRLVKKNTILINLQTKPDFIKESKDVYRLKIS
ncbi:MAG: HTH domain-containing protein [bacterium]